MPLYEIVKADGTREKVCAYRGSHSILEGVLSILKMDGKPKLTYAPGTWLEVWRREGVGE